MKTRKPMASVLSHLKPKSGFSFADDAPTNFGGVNLPFSKTKTGAPGSKFASGIPAPKTGKGNKKLTT